MSSTKYMRCYNDDTRRIHVDTLLQKEEQSSHHRYDQKAKAFDFSVSMFSAFNKAGKTSKACRCMKSGCQVSSFPRGVDLP